MTDPLPAMPAPLDRALAQLDGYPEMMLESVPDPHDLREKVNHYREADPACTRHYRLLFATERVEVQQVGEMVGQAAAVDIHPDQEAAIKLIAALSDTSND
jgi:hypothetical protein